MNCTLGLKKEAHVYEARVVPHQPIGECCLGGLNREDYKPVNGLTCEMST